METLINALNTLPVSAAILDASGTIVAVNNTWKEFGRRNGLRIPNWGVGADYLKYSGDEGLRSARFVRDLRDLLARRLDLLTAIYPCHSPGQKRWFSLVGVPFPLDKPAGAALLHVNLTNMLKLPMEGRPQHLKTTASDQGRSGPGHSNAQIEAISDAIERSVSETLSAQIMAMLEGGTSSRSTLRCLQAIKACWEGMRYWQGIEMVQRQAFLSQVANLPRSKAFPRMPNATRSSLAPG